jgi:hypothetical protein
VWLPIVVVFVVVTTLFMLVVMEISTLLYRPITAVSLAAMAALEPAALTTPLTYAPQVKSTSVVSVVETTPPAMTAIMSLHLERSTMSVACDGNGTSYPGCSGVPFADPCHSGITVTQVAVVSGTVALAALSALILRPSSSTKLGMTSSVTISQTSSGVLSILTTVKTLIHFTLVKKPLCSIHFFVYILLYFQINLFFQYLCVLTGIFFSFFLCGCLCCITKKTLAQTVY